MSLSHNMMWLIAFSSLDKAHVNFST
jgi:hypothetical protein